MSAYVVEITGLPNPCADLTALIEHHLVELGMPEGCEVSVAFVDESEMSALHERWMGEAGPTDVLSFPMDELVPRAAEPGVLGDIAVCIPVAERQAETHGRSLCAEVGFLVTHGTLHLLGYDHATEEEYREMFALQDSLLESWGNRT
ncbi:MAG: rRNA maturation RNase YbeY [Actinobacteria bacterium]|nr:rRNA maturation RNase YbeY [Actinomycetota bacterium]